MSKVKSRLGLNDSERVEKEFFGSKDDRPEDRTVTSRAHIRTELSSQIEAFLSEGGAISEVAVGVTNDPPKKPTSNYGSRPI
ncbi:hypothetical protein [Aurantivibrio plasticivorans]